MHTAWYRNLQRGIDHCLPMQCVLCDQCFRPSNSDHLCAFCRLALPLNIHACRHCALPLDSERPTHDENESTGCANPVCGACLSKPLADRAMVPLLHTGPAAHLVHRLKFSKGETEGLTLAQTMLTHINLLPSAEHPDLLVPVPMAYRSAVKRGFNQSVALASHIAHALKLPVAADLLKRRGGPAQHTLSRAKRQHLAASSFQWRSRQAIRSLQGAHVAVVDDVLTTGATAREIIKILRHHGAIRVDIWCATRTPHPQA